MRIRLIHKLLAAFLILSALIVIASVVTMRVFSHRSFSELEFRAMRGSQVCIEEHSSPRRVEYR